MRTLSPQDVLCIIPARGGSKGIPRKNLCEIGGYPLIAHSIVQALRTPVLGRVVVSTDDGEIGDVAAAWGAEVVRRPAEISGDHASSESALLHVLDDLLARDGYRPGVVVFLQATSPLRRPGDIQGAVAALCDAGADSVFSAAPLHGFLWRRRATDGTLVGVSYDHRRRPRRQDAPEEFVENGSIYVTREPVLRRDGNRLGGKIVMYRMHPLDSFQIDEPADLELLNELYVLRGTPLTSTGPGPRVAAAVGTQPGAGAVAEAKCACPAELAGPTTVAG